MSSPLRLSCVLLLLLRFVLSASCSVRAFACRLEARTLSLMYNSRACVAFFFFYRLLLNSPFFFFSSISANFALLFYVVQFPFPFLFFFVFFFLLFFFFCHTNALFQRVVYGCLILSLSGNVTMERRTARSPRKKPALGGKKKKRETVKNVHRLLYRSIQTQKKKKVQKKLNCAFVQSSDNNSSAYDENIDQESVSQGHAFGLSLFLNKPI